MRGSEAFIAALATPVIVLSRGRDEVRANSAWERMAGECGPTRWTWLRVVVEEDRERVRRVLSDAFASPHPVSLEFSVHAANGEVAVLGCIANPWREHGEDSIVAVFWDLSQDRTAERQLAFMAEHDSLTGLVNRRAFDAALRHAAQRADRGASVVLLTLDLDHLKRYNDVLGHLAGDQALVNFALLLKSHVRAVDLPARLGGDEFAVILDEASFHEAWEIAERIRVASAEEFVASSRELGLGVSGGLARVAPGMDERAAMDRADAALYAAKQQGRNRIVVWEPSLGGLAVSERLSITVRRAFTNGGLHVLYQPVVRLGDGHIEYFESLVRVEGANETELTPAEFFPAIERLGLGAELSRRVLTATLDVLAEEPEARVSMNLAASDLGDEQLLDFFAGALESHPDARDRISLEIPESALLPNLAGARAWHARLAPFGVHFVLDDFGSGLGVCHLLDERWIEQVKLSRAVVRALSGSPETRAFVSAVRELIESQGKIAVAGFLETDELIAEGLETGFSVGQGYGLMPPRPDLPSLLGRTIAPGPVA